MILKSDRGVFFIFVALSLTLSILAMTCFLVIIFIKIIIFYIGEYICMYGSSGHMAAVLLCLFYRNRKTVLFFSNSLIFI